MPGLRELMQSRIGPTNSYLGAYVSPFCLEAAKAGRVVDEFRYFSAQGFKGLGEREVSAEDFAELREALVEQHVSMGEKAEEQLGGLVTDLKTFDPHLELEHAVAYSMRGNYAIPDESGAVTKQIAVTTVAVVRVKQRVFFLYTFGGEDDLKWSQTKNNAWINAVLTSNQVTAEEAASEPYTKAPKKGFNWGRVLLFAAIGGVAGGLGGLFNKLKKSN